MSWWQRHTDDKLDQILAQNKALSLQLNHLTENIMAAIDDLKAKINDLITEAVSDLESVIAQLQTAGGGQDAAIVALTQQAQAGLDQLKADMAKVVGAPTPTASGTKPSNP